jgi:hypothetical protein
MIENNNIPGYVFVTQLSNHLKYKKWFLNYLSTINVVGVFNESEKIYNTDYYITNKTIYQEYYNYFTPIFKDYFEELTKHNNYNEPISLHSMWFQQYQKGDFHNWHRHPTSFSNVYYINLDDKNSKTIFLLNGREFYVDVKEGQILTFPSYIQHCSKPNQSNNLKTVIAFNSY